MTRSFPWRWRKLDQSWTRISTGGSFELAKIIPEKGTWIINIPNNGETFTGTFDSESDIEELKLHLDQELSRFDIFKTEVMNCGHPISCLQEDSNREVKCGWCQETKRFDNLLVVYLNLKDTIYQDLNKRVILILLAILIFAIICNL